MGDIVRATPQDIPELIEVFDRANDYGLNKAGVRLWIMVDRAHAALKTQVERGECWVTHNEAGEITAMIAFNDDPGEWGELGKDNRALYFHKWIKDPERAAGDEALTLLRFVARQAQKMGKTLLRCDTVSQLTGLIEYYKKLGFKERGRFIYDFSNRPGVLLEIPANIILKSS